MQLGYVAVGVLSIALSVFVSAEIASGPYEKHRLAAAAHEHGWTECDCPLPDEGEKPFCVWTEPTDHCLLLRWCHWHSWPLPVRETDENDRIVNAVMKHLGDRVSPQASHCNDDRGCHCERQHP